jgi:trans-2-enoyl-CoA reductase
MKLLGDGGTLVTYGGMSKKPITLATGPLIFKDIRLRGFWLGKWKSNHSNEDFAEMTNMLLGLVRDGKLQYAIEKVPFGDFNNALDKAMGKQGSISKQVLIF